MSKTLPALMRSSLIASIGGSFVATDELEPLYFCSCSTLACIGYIARKHVARSNVQRMTRLDGSLDEEVLHSCTLCGFASVVGT